MGKKKATAKKKAKEEEAMKCIVVKEDDGDILDREIFETLSEAKQAIKSDIEYLDYSEMDEEEERMYVIYKLVEVCSVDIYKETKLETYYREE